jgi:hypothetical protein
MSRDFKKILKEKGDAKKKNRGSKLIAVRLPMDIHDAVRAACSSTGLNQSEVVIEALKSSLGIKNE